MRYSISQFKVTEPEWGETFLVSPLTGDLVVLTVDQLSDPTLKSRLKRIHVVTDAPEWEADPFCESLFLEDGSAQVFSSSSEALDYSVWNDVQRRRFIRMRRWRRLSDIVGLIARSPRKQSKHKVVEVLRAINFAGKKPKDECLITAFVESLFLVQRNVPCTLSIGCWTPTIDMHAWTSIASLDDAGKEILVSEPLDRVSLYRPALQFHFT